VGSRRDQSARRVTYSGESRLVGCQKSLGRKAAHGSGSGEMGNVRCKQREQHITGMLVARVGDKEASWSWTCPTQRFSGNAAQTHLPRQEDYYDRAAGRGVLLRPNARSRSN